MRRKNAKHARALISALDASTLRSECPSCGDEFKVRDAGLFHLDDFSTDAVERLEGLKADIAARRKEIKERAGKTEIDSELRAGSVNLGLILERLAPVNGKIRYPHAECRSLFDPIDYVVFDGLGTGEVKRVVLLELKSGKSRLVKNQMRIKRAVEAGKVAFEAYTCPPGAAV